MAATAYVLVRGVIAMAKGKDVTGEAQQKLDAEARPVPGASRSSSSSLILLVASGGGARPLVKLNKIYTRTGDGGTPGWSTAARVSKAVPRMAAIGDVDEANSAIGVAIAALGDERRWRDAARDPERIVRPRRRPRHAAATTSRSMRCASSPPQVARLEQEIDAMNADLEPLTSFILPGGSAARRRAPPRPCRRPPGRTRGGRACSEAPVNPRGAGLSQPPVGPSVRRGASGRRGRGRRRAVATRRNRGTY